MTLDHLHHRKFLVTSMAWLIWLPVKGIKCSVSGIIVRNDSYSSKGQEVNRLLKENLPQNIYFLDNNNITVDHLNHGGLHFNRRGTGKFAYNLVNYVKSLDFRPKFS